MRSHRDLLEDDAGMVTVEGAYAIAAIVIVVVLAVGVVTGMTAQIRCTDAAREVARLAAAGDAKAREVGAQVAGSGAHVDLTERGNQVVAEVSAGIPMLPGLTVSARAVAASEPDGGGQVEFGPGVREGTAVK